ncbi:4a-hydroxytetrahydrobiopterin dehydratase [Egibacter rhizosphaerae]|uniref:Putative pterin-4-alpha-carbinolamine dehydratase n=1 Tax=Egibacter rhizosphaerae TaxID=1670831 RepID=A0A411YJA9_9ACTN|nr:4a-hydroxytetrahydrobiopterin dehydratase [Egibacter rhizosphaerae]QBI21172.1 4a-hydroxytetrahydrobiopterin dehydratase [Egibacter rhizosphaerae]
MADLLDDATLQARVAELDGWSGTPDEGISKTFQRKDFNDSVSFLNRVAELADEADHHPDVAISWNKVTLTYITHFKGGVTEADVEQARAIDERLG